MESSSSPKNPVLQRSASQRRLLRTNSVTKFGEHLSHSKRKKVDIESSGPNPADMKDFSVIAVYSRESGATHYKNFVEKKLDQGSKKTITSRSLKDAKKSGDSEADIKDRFGRQTLKDDTSFDLKTQLSKLLDQKINPHVIAVIEGGQKEDSITLKTRIKKEGTTGSSADETREVEISYSLVKFQPGHNKKKEPDHRQSMGIYVRKDMLKAYKIEVVDIEVERTPPLSHQNTTMEKKKKTKVVASFKAIAVNYETGNGDDEKKTNKYQSLIVHIPNDFLKKPYGEEAVTKGFKRYADEAEVNGVIVTGFLGDTNYKRVPTDNSEPSLGGHLPSGKTLHPQSSGAKKDSFFMRSIPTRQTHNKHVVLQPSTPNYVVIRKETYVLKKKINGKNHRAAKKAAKKVKGSLEPKKVPVEVTDHPSLIAYTAHAFEILGRDPNALKAYYSLAESKISSGL